MNKNQLHLKMLNILFTASILIQFGVIQCEKHDKTKHILGHSMRIHDNHQHKWYVDTSERCFRSAGALSVYHFDNKHVDIDKLIKCLKREREKEREQEQKILENTGRFKRNMNDGRINLDSNNGFNLFWFLGD